MDDARGKAALEALDRRVGARVVGDRATVSLDVTGLAGVDADALEARVARAAQTLGMRATMVRTAERSDQAAERPARVVAIASGKGGVGKSTVAANLAVALARAGRRIGLLDADIHGPSVPTIMGVSTRAELRDKRIQPIMAHGVAVVSMGLMSDPGRAVAWRGPMASSAMAQMATETDWGALDLLLIDMPPGTGDVSLTLAQKVKPDGVVIVSTPQDLALMDAKRALALFRQLGTPVLGLIENMAIYMCPHCGELSTPFGVGGVEAAARDAGLPVLARLPLDPEVRAAADAGVPVAHAAFDDAAAAVWRAIARDQREVVA